MSSTITKLGTWNPIATPYQTIWNQDTIPYAVLDAKEHSGLLSVYNIFITFTIVLVLFFAVSVVLTITGQYFIDWGSALIGLLGSGGLVLVGWVSKLQIRK